MGVPVSDGPVRSKLFEVTGSAVEDTVSRLMSQVFQLVTSPGTGLSTGVASVSQVSYLLHLARSAKATRIAEVGFNIGFSSLAFLESGQSVQVTSFEIDMGPAVRVAKEFIDSRYSGRHEIVFGDSAKTLPAYGDRCAESDGFDLIFLDGGHDYDTISADIRNSQRLAHENALVVVDDVTPWYPWGTGGMSAWMEAVQEGTIAPLEYVCDGIPKDMVEGPADRVWAVGRFT
jgi:predicted O-methyltransferase YrrM